jgi:Domain of unknown function (DUF4440)
MTSDKEEIVRMFNAYVETFQKLEPRSAATYLNAPCIFVAPQGVRVMISAADIEALLAGIMAQLKAADYSRSAIDDMRVSRMSDHNALVSVRRIRYRSDGSELQQLGETYTLLKVGENWKIVSAMVHDPDALVTLA